ncbi:MAG TPA: sigma-70 family RNA polymerase sigma factor [Gemmata sp.]|jgi:RNA polymerase sigma-70 factor (ECF subfamily)|nr:sigma-70 family RNA polymerase sigma factor [Gemmata sp.]
MADSGKEAGRSQATPLSLLDRIRAKDPTAWKRLIDLYRPLVLFWCSRRGLQGPDAEDVSQEVFAASSAGLDGFRRDRPSDTFRGWLRGITRNQVSLFYRRNDGKAQAEGGSAAWAQLQDVADPLAEAPEGEEKEVGHLYRRALELVRGEFEERTWQAFWLTAIDGRSPVALTVELSMSPASIRQAKSRVLRRLKQEVGDLFD